MAIASFASKVFEVSGDKVSTFDDLQFCSALDTEKQENPGTKPKTYIKGPDLSTLSLKISVSVDKGQVPRSEIESWIALKDAGKPYPFIIAGTPFGAAQWLLKEVQASDFKVDNAGNILESNISLSFEEHVFIGAAKADLK